jgi:hypothetical protein
MRGLFYQANFCAECGNQLDRQRRGCFCPHCAARLGRRRYLLPLLCALCGVVIGLLISSGQRQTALDRLAPLGTVTSPEVSAQDATVKLKPSKSTPSDQLFICGARTKRGTPCRHRTAKGQRCAQHQGRPSMLADNSASGASAVPSK